jgi:hypothetical protein
MAFVILAVMLFMPICYSVTVTDENLAITEVTNFISTTRNIANVS